MAELTILRGHSGIVSEDEIYKEMPEYIKKKIKNRSYVESFIGKRMSRTSLRKYLPTLSVELGDCHYDLETDSHVCTILAISREKYDEVESALYWKEHPLRRKENLFYDQDYEMSEEEACNIHCYEDIPEVDRYL